MRGTREAISGPVLVVTRDQPWFNRLCRSSSGPLMAGARVRMVSSASSAVRRLARPGVASVIVDARFMDEATDGLELALNLADGSGRMRVWLALPEGGLTDMAAARGAVAGAGSHSETRRTRR